MKILFYVYLKYRYSIPIGYKAIRGPTIIVADYCLVTQRQWQKNNFENLSAACGVKV